MIWRKFKALGSEIIITADLDEGQSVILDNAESFILDFEKRFSRFIPGNELYRFNHGKGKEHRTSRMMMDLLIASQAFYFETGGIFDPTTILSLKAVGYSKSFDRIHEAVKAKPSPLDIDKILETHYRRARIESLEVIGDKVRVPANFQIDLGGIGKGFLVDYLAENLFKDIDNFWISAGGDLLAKGNSEQGIGWEIGVQDPLQPEGQAFKIGTKGQKLAVATSGVIKRKGLYKDFEWNHIIDPRVGLPVSNGILSVTVVADTVKRADVFAKTILILGVEAGLDFVESKNDLSCVIFAKGQEPVFSRKMKEFLN